VFCVRRVPATLYRDALHSQVFNKTDVDTTVSLSVTIMYNYFYAIFWPKLLLILYRKFIGIQRGVLCCCKLVEFERIPTDVEPAFLFQLKIFRLLHFQFYVEKAEQLFPEHSFMTVILYLSILLHLCIFHAQYIQFSMQLFSLLFLLLNDMFRPQAAIIMCFVYGKLSHCIKCSLIYARANVMFLV
jgi:hypothetical protein